ncbi:hypothetical protein J6590_067920 [Homalodisca vitripennis]|nr:hypothetical protein J6590_067920 [Homalodisca vitripennis]
MAALGLSSTFFLGETNSMRCAVPSSGARVSNEAVRDSSKAGCGTKLLLKAPKWSKFVNSICRTMSSHIPVTPPDRPLTSEHRLSLPELRWQIS